MRSALTVLFAGALLFASHAASNAQSREASNAQSREAIVDARRINNCLTRVAERKASTYACIGRVAKVCMKRDGGDTTAGMKQCLARENRAWDRMLNRDYHRLRAKLSDEGAKSLQSIQRAWIAWRDQKCEFGYVVYEGGTLAGVVAGNCVMNTTAIRAIELHEALRAVNN